MSPARRPARKPASSTRATSAKKPAPRRTPTKRRTTKKAAPPKPVEPPPTIPAGHRLYILDVPFSDRGVASANGARWHSGLRATIYIGPTLPHGLTPYASHPYSWERWQEDNLNTETGPVPEAEHTLIPREHQIEAAKTVLAAAKAGARGFLLADDVGLGKTLSALTSVIELSHIREIKNVLIVSPLSVVPHWRRSIADIGITEHDISACVINYDRLKKLLDVPESARTAKRTRTKNRRIAKDGSSIIDWDMIILDESHKLKNSSQRSSIVSRIAKYGSPKDDAPFILYMSATAGQNPLEMRYLAPLLAQITKSSGSALKDFGPWLAAQGFHVTHEERYDQWLWTEDPEGRDEDVEKIRNLLFARRTPVALRRIPQDIAGWPEVLRILQPVQLSPEQGRMYEQAWTAFRREMHLIARGGDPRGGMVARLRFRQKASMIRTDGTIEHVIDLLDNGHQVAVSFQFLESLDTVKEGLEKAGVPVAVMDGRDPSNRERNRLIFQTGKAKVCLFSPVEGFSLHAGEVLVGGLVGSDTPRSLVIHDPRYSGIETIQLEGRCVLSGQRVLTGRGAIPIEEVSTTDVVLTREGQMCKVTDVWSRGASNGRNRRKITAISYEGHPAPLKVTYDHEIWVKREGKTMWLEASRVLPGDSVGTPRIKDRPDLDVLQFPDEHRRWKRDNKKDNVCVECEKKAIARDLCPNHYYQYVRKMKKENTPLPIIDRGRLVNPRYQSFPKEIVVNDNFLEFAGWYLAEGCSVLKPDGVGKQVSLSGHTKERKILEQHAAYLLNTFNIKSTLMQRKGTNGIELKTYSADLSSWLHEDFGHMAPNKHLPSWFWQLSLRQQQIMLNSYRQGDGHNRKARNGAQISGWGTSSKRLHAELIVYFASMGYKVSGWISQKNGRTLTIKGRETTSGQYFIGEYLVRRSKNDGAIDKDFVWHKVSSVSTSYAKADDRLWDITVEGDPSYVVESVTVHNCHRDGKFAPAYYMYGEDTVEADVVRTLLGRVESTKALVGDDTTTVRMLEDLLNAG